MANPFGNFRGVAAPLLQSNVDTDKIIPARYLKTVSREGLSAGLFHALRFDESGHERPDFALNREPWRRASILIALNNFGCGSSREHAPWALADFGIRCIIALSFADIFYNNCFRNGILPIVIDIDALNRCAQDAADPARANFSIRLMEQQVIRPNGETIDFVIAADRKLQLALGLDEIDATLTHLEEIIRFEAQHRDPRISDVTLDPGTSPNSACGRFRSNG